MVAADGAYLIDLDVLSEAEARQLLARRLGAGRMAAEPDAVAQIITRCARLPLALALVAARARPGVGLRVVAGELADARQRWQTLTSDDPHTDVLSVFSWSYQALSPAAARLFRLLGLHPGPDIGVAVAASLAGLTPDAVRPVVAELTRVSLLTVPTEGRYAFHDLLRDYARQVGDTIDTDEQRHAATGRLLDHYLHTAHAADRLLKPVRDPISLAPARAGVTPQPFSDHEQAFDWFTMERPILLAAIVLAATSGFDSHAWQLVWTLVTFDYRRGNWYDQVTVGQAAVAAVERLADPTSQIRAHRLLADAYIRVGQFGDAYTLLCQTLGLATRSGDQIQCAHAHDSLSYWWIKQGGLAQGLDHARQALQVFQANGHRVGQARTLNTIGWCHTQLGEHQQALNYCRQALMLHQQLGDRDGHAATWNSLGYAHHHLGHHTQALVCYERALTLSRDIGHSHYESNTLTFLGDTHHANGDSRAARDAWHQALTILEDLQLPEAEQVRIKLGNTDGVAL